MKKYVSKSGKPYGVRYYEIGKDFISIKFDSPRIYTYTEHLNGADIINTMKALALNNLGLSTFITENKKWLKFK